MQRRWLLLCALAACVRSESVQCDDGRLCPASFVCVPDGCRPSGDCGDGALDVGEECDDRNLASHDGCSSVCLTETAHWHDVTDPNGPSLRRGHAMVWVPDRGAGMLQGGFGVAIDTDTWLWDGSWTRVADGPERTFGALAYAGDGRVLHFGGADVNTVRRSDTTLWDGTSWTPLATSGPPARFDHQMARDPGAPGSIVLWGGNADGAGVASDTWRWDGSAWTRQPDQAIDSGVRMTYLPLEQDVVAAGSNNLLLYVWNGAWSTRESNLVRHEHAQDWDAARRRLVVFGGDVASVRTNEVDEWDGIDWVRVPTTEPRPPARTFVAGFYDPIRAGLVIFGGDVGAQFLGDTWILRWESATPDDTCDGVTDEDGDGLSGCADPDCWARCTPLCPPGAACDPAAPHCGDGACNPALESATLCPSDC